MMIGTKWQKLIGSRALLAIAAAGGLLSGGGFGVSAAFGQENRVPAQPASPSFTPPANMGMAFEPDFSRRDAPKIAESLELTDNQMVLFEALLETYLEKFMADAKAARDQMSGLRLSDAALRDASREQMMQKRRVLEALQHDLDELELRREEGEDVSDEVLERLREQIAEVEVQVAAAPPMVEDAAGMREAMNQFQSIMDDWHGRKQELRREFVDDLLVVIEPEQRERWVGIERTMRRERSMRSGVFAGESVDLVALIERMELEDAQRQSAQPTLQDYAKSLDEALINRDELLNLADVQRANYAALQDESSADRLAREEVERRRRVRDLNDTFIASLRSQWPAEAGDALREAYDAAAFPRLAQPTRADRVFDAVLQLRDLNDETRAAIDDLKRQHAEKLKAHDERVRVATREHEPEQFRHQLMRRAGFESDPRVAQPQGDSIRDAWRERTEASEAYVERALALLSDEQRNALPAFALTGHGTPGGSDYGRQMRTREDRQRMMERFDLNSDGTLDNDERRRMRETLMAEDAERAREVEEDPGDDESGGTH